MHPYSDSLQHYAQLLASHRNWWEHSPFVHETLPWEAGQPEIGEALAGLSDQELKELEETPARARRFLSRWLPSAADASVRCEPEAFSQAPLDGGDLSSESIPARKWAQILAFAGACPELATAEILEWCSGKGHLGRALSLSREAPVTCIEANPALAHSGRDLAAEQAIDLQFLTLDALSPDAEAVVRKDQLAVALHACGDLHTRLVKLACAAQTRSIAVAPCCYHLTSDELYRPLSRAACSTDPQLTREQLRLCLQEAVVASPRALRRRDTLAIWRLGFDTLQRELRGRDEYLRVPPVPGSVYRDGFERFLAWAAERKGLVLPSYLDLDLLLDIGQRRYARSRRMALPRHLFRRIMEVWLILDRAQALVESDYEVDVGIFCPREVTPRNIMIRAVRR